MKSEPNHHYCDSNNLKYLFLVPLRFATEDGDELQKVESNRTVEAPQGVCQPSHPEIIREIAAKRMNKPRTTLRAQYTTLRTKYTNATTSATSATKEPVPLTLTGLPSSSVSKSSLTERVLAGRGRERKEREKVTHSAVPPPLPASTKMAPCVPNIMVGQLWPRNRRRVRLTKSSVLCRR